MGKDIVSKENVSQKLRQICMYVCIVKINDEDNKQKEVNDMKTLSNIVGPKLDLLSKLKDIYTPKKKLPAKKFNPKKNDDQLQYTSKKYQSEKDEALDRTIVRYTELIVEYMPEYLFPF